MKQVPAEQVPIVQPPIEQVPIVQLSIEQVPIVELPIEQSPVVDRPPSYVAEEDHLESEGPRMTNTQQENAYLQVRSQPRISPDGRTYLEPLRDSYHPHSAIRELTKIIKKYFHGPWATWEGTPTDVKDRWFRELEIKGAFCCCCLLIAGIFAATHLCFYCCLMKNARLFDEECQTSRPKR
ncbi:putative schizont egress antigen-1 [Senna tora]|uniref:Putative schizont egress antigen-1 n=1 Tax=Senna tora TaxID=362788 RepID=A0A834SK58_9FABA|nr:putative schizont egress antigen-1 [Senna tora]